MKPTIPRLPRSIGSLFGLAAVLAVGVFLVYSLSSSSALSPPPVLAPNVSLERVSVPGATVRLTACEQPSFEIWNTTCTGRAASDEFSVCASLANVACNLDCAKKIDAELGNGFLEGVCNDLCALEPGCTQGLMTASMTQACHVDSIPMENPYVCISHGAFAITCHCLP